MRAHCCYAWWVRTAPSPHQAYVGAKEKLIKAEWHLLDALEYDVAVDNPTLYIRQLLGMLGLADVVELGVEVQKVIGDTCKTQVAGHVTETFFV